MFNPSLQQRLGPGEIYRVWQLRTGTSLPIVTGNITIKQIKAKSLHELV